MPEKALVWLGSSRDDVRSFPVDARRDAGFQLRQVQRGRDPKDWKPMPSIAPGVREIRIHTLVEHRVVYIARFAEAVYVLHAFEKKTRKTPRRELEIARNRLRGIVRERRSEIR
jgi:phage-related protein